MSTQGRRLKFSSAQLFKAGLSSLLLLPPNYLGSFLLASPFAFLKPKITEYPPPPPGAYSVRYVNGYPDTYYARSITIPQPFPQLKEDIDTDVCVVGGGLAGLAAALGLAERGKRVVLLETQRIGASASGMNGGFVLPGFALEGEALAAQVGDNVSHSFYKMSLDALELLRKRIDENKIECDKQEAGTLVVSMFPTSEQAYHDEIEHSNEHLGTKFEFWPVEKVRKHYKTDKYYHAMYNPIAFTVNPLALSIGLARVATEKGVRIFEGTRALIPEKVKPLTPTAQTVWRVPTLSRDPLMDPTTEDRSTLRVRASVTCSDVVLAGAAQISHTDKRIAMSTVTAITYIGVTEPLGDRLKEAIEDAPYATNDDRFALNYYRTLPGGRILWGGFCQTYPISDANLHRALQKDLVSIFPQLEGVKFESVWGGPLAYGRDMFPMIGKKEEGYWYMTGFGGHGLVPTTVAGELIADAIANERGTYMQFQTAFPLKWIGAPLFSGIGVQLMYWAYQARDHFNIWRSKL